MSFGGKDNRGPSIAELQRFIREQVLMVFILNTGEQLTGRLRWFDENAFSLVPEGQQPFTILRSAVVGYRRQGGETPKSSAKSNLSEQSVGGGSQSSSQTMVSTQQEQGPQPSVNTTEEERADG